MGRLLTVLIDLQQEEAFDRRAFGGIATKARDYRDVILHSLGRNERLHDAVHAHQAVGVIFSSDNPATVAEVVATGKPCVNISNHRRGHREAPVVGTDDEAIGALVAEHYLSRGFRNFAFFSQLEATYFEPRQRGFVSALAKAGFGCAVGPPLRVAHEQRLRPTAEMDEDQSWEWRAGRWLASLPHPLAVFAPYDWHARQAVTACQLVGLTVPADVSVIGVDNDEVTCTSIWPPLSSVDPHAIHVGHEALSLLRAMILDGGPVPPQPVLVPPLAIITRGSSSELAVADPDVASAVNFIQANIHKRITVDDVVRHVVISRRTLERRFLMTLGRSPMEELRRSRVERAKQLLIQTDLDLAEVARRSGLIRQQRLCSVLKATTGQTPLSFRMMFRQGVEHPTSE
jgi:LacI family transcriptional regulator